MGASCQLVEKACYRKICRDGSISALRAAAMRRLRSETRLRAQRSALRLFLHRASRDCAAIAAQAKK